MLHINCDMGEGVANENRIMPLIQACSIACGGHYGTIATMTKTVKLAMQYDIEIGAHPSFPDTENFGRKYMNFDASMLADIICNQIIDLLEVVEKCNGRLCHIKAHGALYNAAAKREKEAEALLNAIQKLNLDVPLYAPPESILEKISGERNHPVVKEAFGDRAYTDNYTLLPRSFPGSVFDDVDTIMDRILEIYKYKSITTVSGVRKKILADTICLHSDGPATLEVLEHVNQIYN